HNSRADSGADRVRTGNAAGSVRRHDGHGSWHRSVHAPCRHRAIRGVQYLHGENWRSYSADAAVSTGDAAGSDRHDVLGADFNMAYSHRNEITSSRSMPITALFRLDKKPALVTGCKRGIGRAMAVALAEAGANVI